MGRKAKDLTGMVFGKLKVTKQGTTKTKNGAAKVHWVCECLCGKTIETRSSRLLTGRAKSCGCGKRARVKIGTALRSLFCHYKDSAKHRGLSWELTLEQFEYLTSSPCYYTGKLPCSVKKRKAGEPYVYNGIDRVDNTKGYTLENCVPCCSEINKMKLNHTKEEFIRLCRLVSERRYP